MKVSWNVSTVEANFCTICSIGALWLKLNEIDSCGKNTHKRRRVKKIESPAVNIYYGNHGLHVFYGMQ